MKSFDLIVLGGGSGGLAAAQRAAEYGARVAVFEHGRLGGTCVNVGCVPKKVMWNASEIAHTIRQASHYGFDVNVNGHDWELLKRGRDAYVERLNGIYRRNLDRKSIETVLSHGRFVGPREVVDEAGETYRGEHIVIATGGYPVVPALPGAERGITSDGFFELEDQPERVAVVGSGYIAVELAGVFRSLGSEVSVFVRFDKLLRSFDPMLSDHLMQHMRDAGIEIVTGAVPSALHGAEGAAPASASDAASSLVTQNDLHGAERTAPMAALRRADSIADGDGVGSSDGDGVGSVDGGAVGGADGDGVGSADGGGVGGVASRSDGGAPAGADKYAVSNAGSIALETEDGRTFDGFDALLWAVGRQANTAGLALDAAGVETAPRGHIPVDPWQNTNVEGIYAIGDVTGKAELTPVAIAAGRRLSDRIFDGQSERRLSYELIPTVIFSHPPIGTIGLTEPEAAERHGADVLRVYKSEFVPMFNALTEAKPKTAMKLVTVGEDERVVGCHVIGTGADEMVQGFAVAMSMGACKRDFDDTIAIHPTSAEELVTMR